MGDAMIATTEAARQPFPWLAFFLTLFSWPVILALYAGLRLVCERIELRKYIHG